MAMPSTPHTMEEVDYVKNSNSKSYEKGFKNKFKVDLVPSNIMMQIKVNKIEI